MVGAVYGIAAKYSPYCADIVAIVQAGLSHSIVVGLEFNRRTGCKSPVYFRKKIW